MMKPISTLTLLLMLLICVGMHCGQDENDPPTSPNSDITLVDTDGDGIPNVDDDDIDGDGIPNASDDDMDGDGTVNTQDLDIDGDGIPNAADSDIDSDGIPNASDDDIDGDGIPNDQDPDIDGDSVANADDVDPDATSGNSNNSTGTTDGSDSSSTGIVVVAEDTVTYSFDITNGNTGTLTDSTVTVNLAEIRQELEDKEIDVSSFTVTNLSITATAASTNFISANTDKEFALTAYYLEGGTQVKVAETSAGPPSPFPVLTFSDLNSGLNLNTNLFGSSPGYFNLVDMIKDETKGTVDMRLCVELLEDLAQTGSLELVMIIEVTGKKNV